MPAYTGGELNLAKPILNDEIEESILDIAENFQKIDDAVSEFLGAFAEEGEKF